MKWILFINFFLLTLSPLSCAKHSLSKKRWQLVWNEEFKDNKLDTEKWSKIPRGKSDWNKYMSNFDSCYELRNGNLILKGIKNRSLTNDTATYLTGGVYTKNKVNFGYGRLEIKAKFQGAKGAWPAFWMLPEKGKWPMAGEIDIMERLSYDSFVYQTIHTNYTYNLKIKDNPKSSKTIRINPDDYKIYTLEKYPDSLVFYINGIHNFTYPRIKTDKEGQFPFDQSDYYLLLDMQLGGSWVGEVDPKDIPVEMAIDYVRFYKLKE
ncbi:MAG: glycoside hydrolase family 16 protein [Sphingobacteriales bacterium]|nr:glycoside hydrolase family 16 protein [Sphingobacteriales bacterium]